MQSLIVCKGCLQSKPHQAKGYCLHCYHKFIIRKFGSLNKDELREKIAIRIKEQWSKKERIKSKLSKERLEELYCMQKMSMGDIAKVHACSRAYILRLLRKYDLPIRNKSEARAEAKKQGKNVSFSAINENFFKQQTPEMAYVLGFIYSDGNLANGLDYFTISQKEPEILHRIKASMGSEHRIFKQKNQDLHILMIGNRIMINDLIKLGLTPNKSLDIKFPVLPEYLYSHFIRGYFDGDGSIYFSRTWRLSFVSGSKGFLEGLENALCKYANVSRRPINEHISGRAYDMCYLRIMDLMKIYDYFYNSDVIEKKIYLLRKQELFRKAYDWGQVIISKNVSKPDRRYKL